MVLLLVFPVLTQEAVVSWLAGWVLGAAEMLVYGGLSSFSSLCWASMCGGESISKSPGPNTQALTKLLH